MSGSIKNPEYQLEIGKKSIMLDYKKFLLLKGIKDYGSIAKATKKTGLPYRTALKYIEILENQLGSKVVVTQRGGAGGGEAVRVSGAGLGQYRAPVGGFVGVQPEVHVGGCVEPDPGVTMLVVVPVGEGVHEFTCLRE